MDYYLVVDLEMCMVKGAAKKKMRGMTNEIIQIGAVMLNKENHIVDDFSVYVKPEFGKLNKFITDLTGITEENLEKAPVLRAALIKFANWIGERKVVATSWSDSDYHQLMHETRIKKIKDHRIQTLLDEWVDFQRSFDKMLCLRKQFSLEAALEIGRVQPMGRMHDGLCDAYNTARLLAKVQRQPSFQLEFVPIVEYYDQIEHLSYSMEELFTPELLAQISSLEEPDVQEEVIESSREGWSLYRKVYGLIMGRKAVTDENWNKMLFKREMRRLDMMDRIRAIFEKNELAGEN